VLNSPFSVYKILQHILMILISVVIAIMLLSTVQPQKLLEASSLDADFYPHASLQFGTKISIVLYRRKTWLFIFN